MAAVRERNAEFERELINALADLGDCVDFWDIGLDEALDCSIRTQPFHPPFEPKLVDPACRSGGHLASHFVRSGSGIIQDEHPEIVQIAR